MASTAGISSEKTKFGSMLSSPLITMAISLILCNIGVLPGSSNVYDIVTKYLVPLAVPLLLLDADLRKCFKSMKQLLKAFIVGSIGTFVGTIVAYILVPMKSIPRSLDVAAALCARHIGGAVNFIAVAEILKIPSEIITAAIAADNVVVAIYFAFLFAISVPNRENITATSFGSNTIQNLVVPKAPIVSKCPIPMFSQLGNDDINAPAPIEAVVNAPANESIPPVEPVVIREKKYRASNEVTLETLLGALSLSFILCSISHAIAKKFAVSSILLSSLLAVAAATLLPDIVAPLSKSGGMLGVCFMQVLP